MPALAVLSMHTSPLAQPGTGDGGGNERLRPRAERRPGPLRRELRGLHPGRQRGLSRHRQRRTRVPGPPHRRPDRSARWPRNSCPIWCRPGQPGSPPGWRMLAASGRTVDAIHANYWLSGLAGHTLKHELDVPLLVTFHTLDRVKADASPEELSAAEPARRAQSEAEIVGCADAVVASCSVEAEQLVELYGRPPGADRHRGPRRGPRLLQPRRPGPGPAGGRSAGARSGGPVRGPDPAAQGVDRGGGRPGRDARRMAWPPPCWWCSAARAGLTATRSWQPVQRRASPPMTLKVRCACCRRSATRCCPATTGPRTSAWYPAIRSRSGWWPWRPQPAGCRWWPPRSAGSPPSWTTGGPGIWLKGGTRRTTPAPWPPSSPIRALAARLGQAGAERARAYTWAAAAADLWSTGDALTASCWSPAANWLVACG